MKFIITGRPTSEDMYSRSRNGCVGTEIIATIKDNKELAERILVAAASHGAWTDLCMTEEKDND